ncbi:hypothetical protein GCM10017562_28670 [Streptomyces roseofulvus]
MRTPPAEAVVEASAACAEPRPAVAARAPAARAELSSAAVKDLRGCTSVLRWGVLVVPYRSWSSDSPRVNGASMV